MSKVYWRSAGMSYLQYVTQSTRVLRSFLKEPLKTRQLAASNINFKQQLYIGGKAAPKTDVNTYSPPPLAPRSV